MWARVFEIILGIWLSISHFIFSIKGVNDFIATFFIFIFAILSYSDRLNKMHLLQVIPAGWLLYTAYTYPTPFLPFGIQNHILVALTLLMFAVIPSKASDPPRPWKRFLNPEER
jgi:hypothetical protein